MAREFSAGGVVIRRMRGQWWLAVIEPEGRNAPATAKGPQKTVWALPKGQIDEGESAAQAAEREILEETGVRAGMVAKLEDTKYFYVRSWGDGQRVFKVVTFFLFHYISGRLGEISDKMKIEVRRAEWMPLGDAGNRLTYQTERMVVAKAIRYLKEHPYL